MTVKTIIIPIILDATCYHRREETHGYYIIMDINFVKNGLPLSKIESSGQPSSALKISTNQLNTNLIQKILIQISN